MSAVHPFQHDIQFLRLVRRESDVDLVVAALEIARDGQPDLEFEPTLRTLRNTVAHLTRPVAMAGADISELNLLVRYLSDELHLHGSHDCYELAESSYLNRVVETGRGLPITLSIVYMAVANELGIPLCGVAAPSHFLTRLQTDSGAVYVDAFRGGHLMDEIECVEWLHEITEIPVTEIYPALKPVSERTIVVRMLKNLKALFGSRDEWTSARKVQQRLLLLNPSSYRERRDLAIISLRAGRFGEAIDLLENCLKVCGPEERLQLKQYLSTARAQLPLCN
ncbi:MAG: tetratricopeptide repeat protein [Planctomycetaceae bacterium]